jgi:hypothetical protein
MFEDQLGNFNLWAYNIGAFATTRASLDSRLRESENTRETLLQLLEALQMNLAYGKSSNCSRISHQPIFAAVEISDRPKSPIEAEEQNMLSEPHESDTDSFSTTSSDSRRTNRSSEEWRENPTLEILEAVKSTITRLQRISVQIKRYSKQGRDEKVAKFNITDPDDLELHHDLAQYATWVIRYRYPSLDERLQTLLLDALLFRQKRFLYRRARTRAQKTLRFGTLHGSQEHDVQNSRYEYRKSTTAASRVTSQLTATTFNEKAFKRETTPSRRTASSAFRSIVQDGHMDWPPPPKPQTPGSFQCTCPYCFELISDNEMQDKTAWRLVERVTPLNYKRH